VVQGSNDQVIDMHTCEEGGLKGREARRAAARGGQMAPAAGLGRCPKVVI
jgi:hypothetical protein